MTIKNSTVVVCGTLGKHSVTKGGERLQLSIVALLFGIIIGLLGAVPAACAVFPDHPIRLICPSPPGSGSDAISRLMADNILPILGQPFVVDNRPGSNGIVAASLVAKAKPDGYTLLFAFNQTHGTNSCMFSDLPYDPIKDFDPVINLYQNYPLFVVTAKLPVYSVAELIAYAKAHPGLKFASTGVGGPVHLPAVDFASRVGIKLTHIPYTNMGEMFTDLSNGDVSLLFYTPMVVQPLIDAGKVRPLATTGTTRMSRLPNVPTMTEAGVPNFIGGSFNGIFAPARTPKDVIQVLFKAFEKVMKDPAIVGWLEPQGYRANLQSPDEFAKLLPTEIERLCKIVEAAGAKVR